jgi:hypothetical protein
MKIRNKTKNKKASFNKTEANVLINKLVSSSKHLSSGVQKVEDYIVSDIYTTASYCSFYDYKSKSHTSYIKRELENKNIYNIFGNSKAYINRLFQCSNSLLMREVYGINQTDIQIKKTLDKLGLKTRYAILDYINSHELTEQGEVIEKPKKEPKEEKPKEEKIENLNLAQFFDKLYNLINDKVENKSCKEYQEFASKINQDVKKAGEEMTKAKLEKIG